MEGSQSCTGCWKRDGGHRISPHSGHHNCRPPSLNNGRPLKYQCMQYMHHWSTWKLGIECIIAKPITTNCVTNCQSIYRSYVDSKFDNGFVNILIQELALVIEAYFTL